MEAFVYSWKNKNTGMEYVGYHKGSVDDGYVSSSKNEMFWEDYNLGLLEREILFEGTCEECIKKESNILRNRGFDNLYNRNLNGKIVWTEDVRKKVSDSLKGRKQSKEHVNKRAESLKGRESGFKGKEHSEETINKMKQVKRSDNHKKSISKALKGRVSPTKGIAHKKINCPHCKKDIAKNVYSRWHGDNCKEK